MEFDVEKILLTAERKKQERAQAMPTEAVAIQTLTDAIQRLKELGWNDAIYSPKNGAFFEALNSRSGKSYQYVYHGEWPNGGWRIEEGGGCWPGRPILYRLIAEKNNG